MRTHDQIVKKLMKRPGVRAEVERLEREETALLDLLLKARQEAGLAQAQVAERMGTQAPAVARDSSARWRRRAQLPCPWRPCAELRPTALGKRLVLQVA